MNLYGGFQNKSILMLGRLCHDTLMQKGREAFLSLNQGALTEVVEDVIEANIYLAGIAGESGGLAAAHAIHNGFTTLPETKDIMHGEKVAFCTITQLVLENQSRELIQEVIEFCLDVDLPVTLSDMNIKKIDKAQLMQVATRACAEHETIHREPFKVTPEMVMNAILLADELGKYYRNKRK